MRAPRIASRAARELPICRANVKRAPGIPVAHHECSNFREAPMTDPRPTERTPWHISDAVRASISGDGLVLLDLQGGVVLASNAVGARIWQLLEARLDCREIATRLAREYEVSIDRAQHDVAAFLTALESRGLVSAAPAC
jgi:hypothetical protein